MFPALDLTHAKFVVKAKISCQEEKSEKLGEYQTCFMDIVSMLRYINVSILIYSMFHLSFLKSY